MICWNFTKRSNMVGEKGIERSPLMPFVSELAKLQKLSNVIFHFWNEQTLNHVLLQPLTDPCLLACLLAGCRPSEPAPIRGEPSHCHICELELGGDSRPRTPHMEKRSPNEPTLPSTNLALISSGPITRQRLFPHGLWISRGKWTIWLTRIHRHTPPHIHHRGSPHIPGRIAHLNPRNVPRSLPDVILRDLQHTHLPPIPVPQRNSLLNTLVLDDWIGHGLVRFSFFPTRGLAVACHSLLLCCVCECACAKLPARVHFGDGVHGLFLSVLRVFHLKRESAEFLAIHALHLPV